jgi:hypothetical protein
VTAAGPAGPAGEERPVRGAVPGERPPLPDEATATNGPARTAAPSARNRTTAEVRRLIDLLVGRPLADADLDAAAAELARVGDRLEQAAGPGKRPRGQPDHTGHPQDFFATSPVIGYGNPLAAPVDVWAVRGESGQLELRGRAWFGYAYEGPPTCVHGGVVAEMFDELLGSANIVTGTAGMTGTLSIRYRQPTPLLTELAIEARQTRVEGRKIFTWGGLYHDGVLTAEAEGVFIEVRPQRMLDIVATNARGAGGEVIDPELQSFVERGAHILGVDGPPPS